MSMAEDQWGQQPASRPMGFGDHISRGCQVWWDNWADWLGVMLIGFGITLVSMLLCIGPMFVIGPIAVGGYAVALACLRGQPNVSSFMRRGMDVLGPAMGAGIIMTLISAAPILILYALMLCAGVALSAAGGGEGLNPALAMQPVDAGNRANLDINELLGAGGPGQLLAQVEREPGNFDFEPLEENEFPANPNVMFNNGPRQQGPPPAGFFLLMAVFYFLVFVCGIVSFVINTRLIFVYPLLADYEMGVSQALSLSWQSTKKDFFPLLALHFVAAIIASLGAIACGIGQIFTAPILMTVIGSAYLARFPRNQQPEELTPNNNVPPPPPSDNPFAAPS